MKNINKGISPSRWPEYSIAPLNGWCSRLGRVWLRKLDGHVNISR